MDIWTDHLMRDAGMQLDPLASNLPVGDAGAHKGYDSSDSAVL